jgi:hypothetical protein
MDGRMGMTEAVSSSWRLPPALTGWKHSKNVKISVDTWQSRALTGICTLLHSLSITDCAHTLQRHNTDETNIPRKEFVASIPISTFMCLEASYTVYSHNWSAYFSTGKYVEYINR